MLSSPRQSVMYEVVLDSLQKYNFTDILVMDAAIFKTLLDTKFRHLSSNEELSISPPPYKPIDQSLVICIWIVVIIGPPILYIDRT